LALLFWRRVRHGGTARPPLFSGCTQHLEEEPKQKPPRSAPAANTVQPGAPLRPSSNAVPYLPLPRRPRRGLLIAAAAVSAVVIPWELGFGDPATIYDPAHNPAALLDAALVVLFCADIAVSRAAAIDADELLVEYDGADHHAAPSGALAGQPGSGVEDPLAQMRRARASRLVLDVLSGVPFDLITYTGLVAVGRVQPAEAAAMAAPLKLLHLVRLYRVRWFFRCVGPRTGGAGLGGSPGGGSLAAWGQLLAAQGGGWRTS
jgi:hypothetical protein